MTPYFGPSDHEALVDHLACGIRDLLWGQNPGIQFEVLAIYTPPGGRLGRMARITFELESEVKDCPAEKGPPRKRWVRLVGIHWRPVRATVEGRPLPFDELDQIKPCGISEAVMGAGRRFDTPDWGHVVLWTGRQLPADKTPIQDPWDPAFHLNPSLASAPDPNPAEPGR